MSVVTLVKLLIHTSLQRGGVTSKNCWPTVLTVSEAVETATIKILLALVTSLKRGENEINRRMTTDH